MQIPKRGTLARKLMVIILGSIAIAVATFTAAFLLSGTISFRSALNSRLVTLSDVIGQNSTAALNFGDEMAATEVLAALRADDAIVAGCLYDSSGRLFAKYQRDTGGVSCPPFAASDASVKDAYYSFGRPVVRKGENVGNVLLVSDWQDIQRRQHRLLWVAFGLLVITLGLGGWCGSILQRQISEPIRELVTAMHAVTAEQNYSTRVSLDSAEEINTLGEGLNAMLAQIQHRDGELQQHKENLERELTARKRINLELARTRDEAEAANRAKSEFLANMSHEIRTPMNGVIGMTELAMETKLTAEQREYLSIVKMSADSLLSIINDILDFSKIEAGRLEVERFEFNICDLVSETLRGFALAAHQKGLELSYDIRPTIAEKVIGDPHRLRQVLTNIVANAIKFTERGEVVLVLDREPERGPEMLHFVVRDTGIGVPKDKVKLIFEAFSQADTSQTRKYGGTGLGLAISSRLVRLMDGELWMESHVGQGSEFHISLPLPPGSPVSVSVPKFLEGVTALVVEDNLTNRKILGAMMTQFGMKVDTVESALRGLSALEAAANGGDAYKLVLVDGQMPDMDGFQLVESIKKNPNLAGATVVMLTCGRKQPEQIARCRALGVHAYLIKPIRRSELLNVVVRVLGNEDVMNSLNTSEKTEKLRNRPLRLLAAEDNRVNQRLLARLLEKQGHAVTIVEDGEAAVAISGAQRFNAILMDVQMPKMDGLEATRQIRLREELSGEHIPIIALTAHAMKGDREKCLEAGMDTYITKPLHVQELLSVLDKASLPGDFMEDARQASESLVMDVAKALEYMGGDRALLSELCEVFLDESPAILEQLSRSIADTEPDTAQRVAHKLKTSAGTIGGTRAYEAARAVEHLAESNSLEEFEICGAVLQQEISALRIAAAEFVSGA